MDNRFRRLPPRIEPRYETQDVSDPPPLPEVEETNWLTPAGEVAAYEQMAKAIARDPDRPLVHLGRRRRVLVAICGALVLGMLAAAVASAVGLIWPFR
jgi:hypothetical protein